MRADFSDAVQMITASGNWVLAGGSPYEKIIKSRRNWTSGCKAPAGKPGFGIFGSDPGRFIWGALSGGKLPETHYSLDRQLSMTQSFQVINA
jgi:hypothetical protein